MRWGQLVSNYTDSEAYAFEWLAQAIVDTCSSMAENQTGHMLTALTTIILSHIARTDKEKYYLMYHFKPQK